MANFHVVEMIEDALGFVRRCKTAGLRLGLTTSAARSVQQLAFQTFELHHYFDAVVTGEDIVHGKPDPEPYRSTAAKLSLSPTACLVIEDAVNGVISGKAAGCFVVGITTSFTTEDLSRAGADLVFTSFRSLENQLFSDGALLNPRAHAG